MCLFHGRPGKGPGVPKRQADGFWEAQENPNENWPHSPPAFVLAQRGLGAPLLPYSFYFPAPNPGFTLIHQLSPRPPQRLVKPAWSPRPTTHCSGVSIPPDFPLLWIRPSGAASSPVSLSLSQLNQSSSRTMTVSGMCLDVTSVHYICAKRTSGGLGLANS